LCGRGYPVDLKVVVHDQENIDIFWCWLRGDETAPDEIAAQFSARRGEFQQRPKAA
jgi:hypothetical protein